MQEFIIAIAKQALLLALIITAPPVMVALLVGLTISILQATTQIQEMTLTFVPKLVGVVSTLGIAGPWMLEKLIIFTNSALTAFPRFIQ